MSWNSDTEKARKRKTLKDSKDKMILLLGEVKSKVISMRNFNTSGMEQSDIDDIADVLNDIDEKAKEIKDECVLP